MPDITIFGAGIFGLSTAWSCIRQGARVQVIDPAGPGAGSSGGLVGALAPHVPENWNAKKAFQLDSLLMAETFWAGVSAASGLPTGYARLGRLQPVADEAAMALAKARELTAQELWQGRADWRLVRAGDHALAPHTLTGWLIFDTLTARLHPRQACAALAAAINARGGQIVAEGRPSGQVLRATGVAGLDEMSARHPRLIGNGVKGQAALLDFDARALPQVFADTVHIVPHADGTTAIGSTSERFFDDASSTDTQLDDVIETARRALPALAKAPVIERWAGVRPRSRSRAPMLGRHPFREGEYVANGGFKIGFGMAPKAGAVMADLMLTGHDAIPQDFRPEASL